MIFFATQCAKAISEFLRDSEGNYDRDHGDLINLVRGGGGGGGGL